MDVVSHALWGVAVSRGRVRWWAAAAVGALPDLVAFVPARIQELAQGNLNVFHEPRPLSEYPAMTMALYRGSHSLAGLATIAVCTWAILRFRPGIRRSLENPLRPPPSAASLTAWLLAPWALHLAIDAPLHTVDFFPTPLFWPFSDWVFAGIPWAQPGVWLPNVVLLTLALWFTWPRRAADTNQGR